MWASLIASIWHEKDIRSARKLRLSKRSASVMAKERGTEAHDEAQRRRLARIFFRQACGNAVPIRPDFPSSLPALAFTLPLRCLQTLNAGYGYLEVRCLGCNTHQTIALDIVRRPKTTPIHELERYMRCKGCSEVRRYPYKRSHLVALRATRISVGDPPSTWWPGER
jgi:hypothetical protein